MSDEKVSGVEIVLDTKEEYEFSRIAYGGGKIRFTITKGEPESELHEFETYKSALPFWKTVHSRANTAERNRHFKTIESKVKEIEKRENDKQGALFDGEEEAA